MSFRPQAQGLIEKHDQPHYVSFGQPPHLAFPNHLHHLVSLDRPPGPSKGSESLAGVDPSFDCSMVLFHDVVQVRASTTATRTAQFSLPLQFRYHFGIRRIAVPVDHSGARVTGST